MVDDKIVGSEDIKNVNLGDIVKLRYERFWSSSEVSEVVGYVDGIDHHHLHLTNYDRKKTRPLGSARRQYELYRIVSLEVITKSAQKMEEKVKETAGLIEETLGKS